MTAGIVLTGGRSSRLGIDKATLVLRSGETIAQRCVRLLREVCDDVVEVGQGVTDARRTRETPTGGGPVAALLAGATITEQSVVLLACDYPCMTVEALDRLARYAGDSLVPVIYGRAQFVAARYGPLAIELLRDSFDRGEQSFRSLDLVALDAIGEGFDAAAFFDIDTAHDLGKFHKMESKE